MRVTQCRCIAFVGHPRTRALLPCHAMHANESPNSNVARRRARQARARTVYADPCGAGKEHVNSCCAWLTCITLNPGGQLPAVHAHARPVAVSATCQPHGGTILRAWHSFTPAMGIYGASTGVLTCRISHTARMPCMPRPCPGETRGATNRHPKPRADLSGLAVPKLQRTGPCSRWVPNHLHSLHTRAER